jgi:DNA sulfur modification protein DndD
MKINSITLENFGSYEGFSTFNTEERDGRNIILIGGKNGAGKTTLFTAMRLCLYGFMSMGYKSHNAYYSRAITKLINNSVKLTKPANASVSMNISISNGHEMDQYVLTRIWTLNDTLTEEYQVLKNGIPLDSEEIADFDKFLFSIIPPELFNLYFFDGEKIADFFLEEGSNANGKTCEKSDG